MIKWSTIVSDSIQPNCSILFTSSLGHYFTKLVPFLITKFYSPTIMSDLPFGDKKVVTSDGTKYTIPNSLRHHRASEIVHMYTAMMTKKKLEHLLFSKSTLFKILSYCAATERKATICVDYFYSESELVSDKLIVRTIEENNYRRLTSSMIWSTSSLRRRLSLSNGRMKRMLS